ncbi:MAG: phosphotransferase, partial [Nocardioidaceae bacterium]|nr:phosphotransferase [Nocardioidaceae bacterium]
HGPTMLESLVDGSLDVQAGGVLLADLHRRLHDLPALLSADATDRILHLDLHPGNVLLSPRGPVVIDWRNATEGPADLDLALSALILAEVAVEKANPLASAASLLLSAFLESAGGDPLRTLSQAVEIRRADPALLGADAGLLGEAAGLISRSR